MTNTVALNSYYANLSDEELAQHFAEGSEKFLPTTWEIITEQVARRKVDVGDDGGQESTTVRTKPASVDAGAPFKSAAIAAYVLAALFTVLALSTAFSWSSPQWTTTFLICAVGYGFTGVRLKVRQSAHAALVGLWLTLLMALSFVALEIRTPITGLWWAAILFGAPCYWFTKAYRAGVARQPGKHEAAATP